MSKLPFTILSDVWSDTEQDHLYSRQQVKVPVGEGESKRGSILVEDSFDIPEGPFQQHIICHV